MRLLMYSEFEDSRNYLLKKYSEDVVSAIKFLAKTKGSPHILQAELEIEKAIWVDDYFLQDIKELLDYDAYNSSLTDEIKNSIKIVKEFYNF